jgi:HAE1 family hydrophobic/amphiphilic exporter-1
LFLGLRQAIISSLTVPLTFLSAFFVMNLIGMSINFLSLFAFLLALGLLVDDTIVVVSAMTSYYKLGKFTPMQTGLLVWKDTIVPIWSTTITTIWSFVPLLLASGIIGEFIKPIPIVVTVTMISSTAIAVLITLPIMIVLLQPQIAPRVLFLMKALGVIIGLFFLLSFAKGNPLLGLIGVLYFVVIAVGMVTLPPITKRVSEFINTLRWTPKFLAWFQRILDHGIINIEGFSAAYYRTIMRIISSKSARYKTILAIIVYALVSFALLPLGLVKGEFFPKSDEETFFISATLPAGSNATQVEAETLTLLTKIKDIPEADFITAETGRALDGNGNRSGSANGVLVTIHIGPEDKRSRSSIEIADDIRQQLKGYSTARLSIIEATGGPPVGADLQIKLLGDDLGTLDVLAEQVMTYLKTQPNVTNVEKSIKPGTSQLVFVPNTTELAKQGVSIDTIGLWLRLYASGLTLDSANFDKSKSEKQRMCMSLLRNPKTFLPRSAKQKFGRSFSSVESTLKKPRN